MAKLAQALADVQAEFDEKTRIIEELTKKLRLQVADTSELKRQLDKVYAQLTEQTQKATAASPPSRRGKLSTDAFSDVLAFLNRFSIDAAQISSRQWRYVVEKMLTTQCLRELNYVTLKRQKKETCAHYGILEPSNWGGWNNERFSDPNEDDNCLFVVLFERSGEAAAPLGGAVQEDMRRGLAFQSFEAASDYLLRLIRSATINHLTLESLVSSEAFFKGLHSVAATIRAKDLTLSQCRLENVDADSFQQTLLQFHSIEKLAVGFHLLPGQISDGFLSAAGDKLALTQLRYYTKGPVGPETATFDVMDYGIMQFLFQRTEKEVELQLSHVNVSTTFCAGLFLKAMFEPAANDLALAIRDVYLEQDLAGILDWHLPELDDNSWGSYKKEIYGADAPPGKRL
ncbi:hypothetical protein AAVH_31740, partial [Aphelenchoides avenae]